MSRYSCEELGVCHCDGACASSKAFAPGVITAYHAPRPRWRRMAALALRWGWRVISVACVLIVLLGLVGMAQGRGVSTVQLVCERGGPLT